MIDINETIERIGIRRLTLLVIGLCCCMMICDGYDFGALAVAAPSILRHWHVAPKAMGAVFSITFIGLLVGSLFYGWLGDRLGRRFTIIVGTCNFGIPILLTAWAADVNQLSILRFIAGVGMGGVVPIVYTLVSDYAPRRMRSTVTVITNAGYSIGSVTSGIVAAVAVAHFGWQALFTIGGTASLLMVIPLVLLLPESPRYLALTDPASPKLRRLYARLVPESPVPEGTVFVPGDAQEKQAQAGAGTLAALFSGPRAPATICLWLLFVCDSLGFFFLSSWLPVVMERQGVSPSIASLTQSLFVFTGMIGGFAIMRFIDRFGPVPVFVLPVIGGPLEILMGINGAAQTLLLTAVAGAGVCLSGIHYAVYGIAVRFYPASIRGRAISSATVFGRAGGIMAPFIGGYFLSANMPLLQLMVIAALPCIPTALVVLALGRLYSRFFADAPLELRPQPA